MTLSKAQIRKYVNRLATIDGKCRELYAERDTLESRVIEAVLSARAGSVPLADGSTVTLKDNFQDREGRPRNTAFKTSAIER